MNRVKKIIVILVVIFVFNVSIFANMNIVYDINAYFQKAEEIQRRIQTTYTEFQNWQREYENFKKIHKRVNEGDLFESVDALKNAYNRVSKNLSNLRGYGNTYTKFIKEIESKLDVIDYDGIIKSSNSKKSKRLSVEERAQELEKIEDKMIDQMEKINSTLDDKKNEEVEILTDAINESTSNLNLAKSESMQEQLGAIIKELVNQTSLMIDQNNIEKEKKALTQQLLDLKNKEEKVKQKKRNALTIQVINEANEKFIDKYL